MHEKIMRRGTPSNTMSYEMTYFLLPNLSLRLPKLHFLRRRQSLLLLNYHEFSSAMLKPI